MPCIFPLVEGYQPTHERFRLEPRGWVRGPIWYVTNQVAQLDLSPMSFHPPPSTQYTQLHGLTINWSPPCNPCLGVSRMPTPIQLRQYMKLKLGSILELNYPKLLLLVTDSAGYWEALKCISIQVRCAQLVELACINIISTCFLRLPLKLKPVPFLNCVFSVLCAEEL